MNRSPDDSVLTDERSHRRCAERICAEMYTVNTGGGRNVRTVVDEQLRARAVDRVTAAADKRQQGACLEVALANLNQIDAGPRGCGDEIDEPINPIGPRR